MLIPRKRSRGVQTCLLLIIVVVAVLSRPAPAQQIALSEIVNPSTVILKDGQPVIFDLHGFIEFKSLAQAFPYIDSQMRRWPGVLTDAQRRDLARDLMRRAVESRIVSMTDERPLEA